MNYKGWGIISLNPHEAAFQKVNAVTCFAADAVKLRPEDMAQVHAALQHQIFHQPTDRVIDERGNDRAA